MAKRLADNYPDYVRAEATHLVIGSPNTPIFVRHIGPKFVMKTLCGIASSHMILPEWRGKSKMIDCAMCKACYAEIPA